MKLLPLASLPLLALLSLASPVARGAAADPQLVANAINTFRSGDLAAAKREFSTINELDPRNATAIQYLRMIHVQEAASPKNAAMEKQLAALIVPKVEFRDATLGSALEYLRQIVPKLDPKQSVNFVVTLPEEQKNTQTISLTLTNVPYTEVLKYVGSLAQLKFEFEKYAIKVTSKVAPSVTAAAVVPAPAAPAPGKVQIPGLPN